MNIPHFYFKQISQIDGCKINKRIIEHNISGNSNLAEQFIYLTTTMDSKNLDRIL